MKVDGVGLNNENTGFKSAIYEREIRFGKHKGEIEYVYATAGTDMTSLADWKNNITQQLGFSEQYDQSISNAQKIDIKLQGSELTFVGHSLGGGLAASNAMATGRNAITFNAASVGLLTKSFKGLNYKPKIDAFIVKGEMLDNLQQSMGIGRANGTIQEIEYQKSWWNRMIDNALPKGLLDIKQTAESGYFHTIDAMLDSLKENGIK